MKKSNYRIQFISIILFLFSNLLFCQYYDFGDDVGKLLLERQKRQQQQEQENHRRSMEEQNRRQEELANISEVEMQITRYVQTTISALQSIDKFNSEIISTHISDLVFKYKNEVNKIKNRFGNNYLSSVHLSRKYIYELSEEYLRNPEYLFLQESLIEKDKLFSYITSNNLPDKTIAKIKVKYNEWIINPFVKNDDGYYIGFIFDINSISKYLPSSGTAFAISSNGIFVTNYHVIQNSDSITLRIGNVTTRYKAKVLIADKNNDLALLKIVDNKFKNIGNIPYIIKTDIIDVGDNIFTLGYPLTSSMGEEIKLTQGIISAKTGFQGDISTYQVSAAVQPGNSGGPLLDKAGNVIGIISSKHSGAENVSYAIKSTYLINLIGILDEKIKLPRRNLMSNAKLSKQVLQIEKYIYIVDVN